MWPLGTLGTLLRRTLQTIDGEILAVAGMHSLGACTEQLLKMPFRSSSSSSAVAAAEEELLGPSALFFFS